MFTENLSLRIPLPKDIGEKKIHKVSVLEHPVEIVESLWDPLSSGKFSKIAQRYGYPKIVGVNLVLNDRFIFNINGPKLIKLKTPKPQAIEIPLPDDWSSVTIEQFYQNTRDWMGENFTQYSITKNNCQDYAWASLEANGLSQHVDKSSICQINFDTIIQEFYTEIVSDMIKSVLYRNILLPFPFL